MFLLIRHLICILVYQHLCGKEISYNYIHEVINMDEAYLDLDSTDLDYVKIVVKNILLNSKNIIKDINDNINQQKDDTLILSLLMSIYVEIIILKQNKTFTILDYLTLSNILGISQKEINFINKIMNNIYNQTIIT